MTRSSVSAQIDLDSLDTGDAGRDKGTLAKDPFDIEHHPAMT
jgi:polyisoprenoid-binding protein YceI